MSKVLLLGNGVSRKEYKDYILSWKSKVWGCNYVFRELLTGDLHRLDVLTGDHAPIVEAIEYKKKYGFTYDIYAKKKQNVSLPGVKELTIPHWFIRNSGIVLVVKALEDGYKEINLVGYDLGGPDLYVKDMEKENKSNWVLLWRKVANRYGLDRIHFIGYDHKPFLLSDKPYSLYYKKYSKGENHLV